MRDRCDRDEQLVWMRIRRTSWRLRRREAAAASKVAPSGLAGGSIPARLAGLAQSPALVLLFPRMARHTRGGGRIGFLQGAWPFGLVEAIWSLVALHRWWLAQG